MEEKKRTEDVSLSSSEPTLQAVPDPGPSGSSHATTGPCQRGYTVADVQADPRPPRVRRSRPQREYVATGAQINAQPMPSITQHEYAAIGIQTDLSNERPPSGRTVQYRDLTSHVGFVPALLGHMSLGALWKLFGA